MIIENRMEAMEYILFLENKEIPRLRMDMLEAKIYRDNNPTEYQLNNYKAKCEAWFEATQERQECYNYLAKHNDKESMGLELSFWD